MIDDLSLIQVGLASIGGGYAAGDNTFGAPKNLLLARRRHGHYYPTLNRQRNPLPRGFFGYCHGGRLSFWHGLWACCLRITHQSHKDI